MRLCANAGASLHLVEPLGFRLEDRLLRRAGLDYRDWADVRTHPSLPECLETIAGSRVFAISTRGIKDYCSARFRPGDAFLFGPESRGLPAGVLAAQGSEMVLRIPMCPGNRSLNLSNAVAIILYEAWRQLGFRGCGSRAPRVE